MAMGMTDTGHIVHAISMFGQTYHLAWGELPVSYPDPWELGDTPPIPQSLIQTDTITRSSSGNLDQLSQTGIIEVITVSQGATVYTASTDYVLNGRSIDWTPAGAQPANATTYTVVYRYNTSAITALIQEVGRREPTSLTYVVQDDNGDIVANDLSWSISLTPTRNLYLQFKFDASDAAGKIIHQMGLFTGTVRTSGTPSGKKYLLPSEIQDPGKLYMLENVEPFSRFAGKREIFEFVITY